MNSTAALEDFVAAIRNAEPDIRRRQGHDNPITRALEALDHGYQETEPPYPASAVERFINHLRPADCELTRTENFNAAVRMLESSRPKP